MAGKKHKETKNSKQIKEKIRKQISAHVRTAFPGCVAQFCGQQSGAALVGRTFGFRVRDPRGGYRSNIIWLNSEYDGEFNQAWVRWAVDQSNG
jgi:hypothetical protein